MRFQPNSGVTDASTVQAFDQVSRVLDATTRVPAFGFLTAAVVQVSAGEFKRLAPRAAGQTVVLPEAAALNAGLSVFLLVNGLGALTVKPVSGTVNGAASALFAAGAYAVELTSDGDGRWLALTVPDGSVTTAKLADLSVTAGKLAALAVTTAKIATAAVTPVKLAAGVVVVVGAGPHHNVALADDTVMVRVETTSTITGFTGGFDGRTLDLYSVGGVTPTLDHATGSSAGNQINCPTSAAISLGVRGGARFIYHSGGWRVVGSANV